MAAWAEAGPRPLPKRDWSRTRQWIVNLDSDRLGDWVIVETGLDATEDDVRKKLTRTQRRKATSIREVIKQRGA